ncbi:MAG: VOC family protein [Fimbriimonas sp.]|nr:VOC family protein [Fimbriimonas sp.]
MDASTNEVTVPPLSNHKIAQVAIAVQDIERAIEHYSALLGQPRPNIIETEPGSEVAMTYRGAPSNARALLAFFDLGGVQLELIQPIGDDSAWAEGLREGGETVHHLAFWTENMRADKDALEMQSVPMIQRGDMGEGQYAYFDGRARFGAMIELLEHRRTSLIDTP